MALKKKKDNRIPWVLGSLGVGALLFGVVGTIKASWQVDSPLYDWNPDYFSRYYTFDQVTHSDTATANNIANVPNDLQILAATQLAQKVLDPITDYLRENVSANALLTVNSWFRSPELNAIIPGSSSNSDHMRGEAADIKFSGGNKYILQAILDDYIFFDQLIIYPGYLHISYDPNRSLQTLRVFEKVGGNYVPVNYADLANYIA